MLASKYGSEPHGYKPIRVQMTTAVILYPIGVELGPQREL